MTQQMDFNTLDMIRDTQEIEAQLSQNIWHENDPLSPAGWGPQSLQTKTPIIAERQLFGPPTAIFTSDPVGWL